MTKDRHGKKALREKQSEKRLTIRAEKRLDFLIRQEASKRGTSINQVMLYIINRLIDSV